MNDRDTKITLDYQAGQSLRQVAQANGVSHETVRLVLKKAGVTARTKSEGMKARAAARQ